MGRWSHAAIKGIEDLDQAVLGGGKLAVRSWWYKCDEREVVSWHLSCRQAVTAASIGEVEGLHVRVCEDDGMR